MKRKLLAAFLFTFVAAFCSAPAAFAKPTSLIDTPTVGMLDYGSYDLGFRLFSDGGVLTRLDFGVFRIVNLGVGWEISDVVGNRTMVVGQPALYLKIKPFAGSMVLPAIAFGYDGQGYFYNTDKKEFEQKEKGVFVVLGREAFVPGLELNAGVNMNDFGTNSVHGFVNAGFSMEDTFSVIGEFDNIGDLPDARLNLGVRFSVTGNVSVDLAGRDICAADRSAERIIRVNYRGKF